MKSMFKSTAVGILATMLSACATERVSYNVDGKLYYSADDATLALRSSLSEAESAVLSTASPLVNRKLLIAVPTEKAYLTAIDAFGAANGKRLENSSQQTVDFAKNSARMTYEGDKSLARSIAKSNIYQEVSIIDIDTPTPDLQPSSSQDIVYKYRAARSDGWVYYFLSAKYGKLILSGDPSKESRKERRLSLIDDLKSKALLQ